MISGNYKVSFAGDTAVGKTSITHQLVHQKFNEFTETTIGACYLSKHIEFDNQKIVANIWDTAGQERYYSLTPMYFKNAKAIILVYDITCKQSFENIKNKWYPDLITHINHNNIAIIGNKLDLNYKRQVSEEEARSFANENDLLFYELSCKTDYDKIYSCFQELARNREIDYDIEEMTPLNLNNKNELRRRKVNCCKN